MISSIVDCKAADRVEGVTQSFPYSGVGMDLRRHIVERGFQAKRGNRFGDDFRGEGTNRMDAKNFAIFGFRDNFDETFMLAEDGGLAVAKERELAGFDFVASITSLFFREANRADLRLAIRGVGAAPAVKGLYLFSGHATHGDDAFHRCRVGELRESRNDIANGI